MTRHLVYHCYPYAANDIWRWNLDQLRQRLELFNGERVVAVALDKSTHGLSAVKDQLRADVDWIELDNDPQISETASWIPLWERIEGKAGYTFRAHTKGVTPWSKRQIAKVSEERTNFLGRVSIRQYIRYELVRVDCDLARRLESKRHWAQMLYEGNLDYWPLIERALETHVFAGMFRQVGIQQKDIKDLLPMLPAGIAWPDWVYMGSFYWVRNEDFFAAPWRTIPQSYYSVELWPGSNFDSSEAACLFVKPRKGVTPMNYPEYTRILWKKFQGWKRYHANDQMVPVSQ